MKKLLIVFPLLAIIIGLSEFSFSQTKQSKENDPTSSASASPKEDKRDYRKIGVAPFPIIFYSPETSLAGGAGAVFTFRESDLTDETRPNNLQIMAIYTLKNQATFQVTPDIYFNDQNGELYINLSYLNWPTSFFGIGNSGSIDLDDIDNLEEEYTTEDLRIQPWLAHKIYSHLSLGVTYDLKNSNISDVEDGGEIDEGDLVGSDGGVSSGLGPAIIWDTRDHIFFPSEGSWHKAWIWVYRDWMGSDFSYEYYSVDFRHYLRIYSDHVLALQGIGVSTKGDVPFSELPTPLMRGLYQDVFKDQDMISLQAEYRFPIKDRWSGAAFLSTGDAFQSNGGFDEINLKYSFGGGIRYMLNKKEKINLRLDKIGRAHV